MIAKHIGMRSRKHSDFAELLHYLLDPQNKNERVGEVHVTNCQSTDAASAIIEVLNTQSMNRRASGDKTYHLVLSFHSGEEPDPKTLQALEEQICSALGYAEHQRLSVVHHDTDYLHVHIAINRIHPKRHTMLNPYNDHVTLGKVCQRLEEEYHLQRDNHSPIKHSSENITDDMEQHGGVESLRGWIRRECWDDLRRATSWSALHAAMSTNGLKLTARGNGLIISAEDGTTIKASSLDRSFSKAGLESHLGPFQPDARTVEGSRTTRCYQHEPFHFHSDTAALYKQYLAQRAQTEQGDLRAIAWANARNQKDRRIDSAKRVARLKRIAIRQMPYDRLTKRFLYAGVYRSLTSKIERARNDYLLERLRIQKQFSRVTWADWLRKEAEYGNADALRALRSRTGQADSDGNTLSGREDHEAIYRGLHIDVTKHGTIIVCAGSTILRDYGSKLAVTRGFQDDGLQVALRLASERYGGCLHVDGSEDFRERIVRAAAQGQLAISFDDAVLEARRLDLIHVATTKGDDHAIRKQPQQGRSAGRGISPDGAGTGQQCSAGHTPSGSKSDIGGIGKVPPPESRNRLRAMPELGVVRVTGRSEVLLPGDVSGHVEQSGAATDHSVRRKVSGAGQLALDLGPAAVQASATAPQIGPEAKGHQPVERLRPMAYSAVPPVLKGKAHASVSEHEISAISASAKYVLEQEQKRLSLPDIPKHLTYDGSQGLATFAGWRAVDGHQLALIRRANEILVVPVDDTTARRLARLETGAVVKLGAIRRKGFTR